MPTVTVILPFFNGDAFIHETLNSVLNQSYHDFEIICVNDGSQPSAMESLKEYEGKIQLINQSNRGQGVARNIGAKHASGEYVAFLDQDDIWYSDKLSSQVAILQKYHKAVLVYCNSDRMNAEGEIFKRGATKEERFSALRSPLGILVGEGLVLPSSMMIRRKVFLEIGGFDPLLKGFEDFDLIVRLQDKGKILFQEEIQMCYRSHDGGYSQAGGLGVIQSREHFLLKMRQLFLGNNIKQKIIRIMLGDCYSDWGMKCMENRDFRMATLYLFRAIKENPFKIRTYSRLVRSVLVRFK